MKKTFFSLIILVIPLFAAVVTEPIIKGDLSSMQSFNGSLSFNEQSRLASESEGKVVRLHFDEGDYVKQGKLLVEIDSEVLDANIKALEASKKEVEFSLQKARLDFKRYEALLAKQSVSQQKYDEFYFQKMQLEQRLLSLESSLEAQNIAKSKKHIYAPFSGYISKRNVQIGEWLQEGGEVAVLINPNKVDITVYLPSAYMHYIKKDRLVDVMINNKSYKAKIKNALLSGDEKTRTFPLRLRLLPAQDKFFDGMQATLSLEKTSLRNTLLVPRDGVIKRFGQNVVFIIKDKKAHMVAVKITGYEDAYVAVDSDELHEGDRVITKGNERIFPNQELQQ